MSVCPDIMYYIQWQQQHLPKVVFIETSLYTCYEGDVSFWNMLQQSALGTILYLNVMFTLLHVKLPMRKSPLTTAQTRVFTLGYSIF